MSTTASTVPGVLDKASEGLSVTEAARRLGVTAQTIRNWIDRGDLPATMFGPARRPIVRIDPADLEKLRRPA